MKDDLVLYWLASTDGIGARRFSTIKFAFPDITEIFYDPYALREYKVPQNVCDSLKHRANEDLLRSELHMLKERSIGFVSINHEDYPELLRHIYDPPIGLYVRGDLSCIKQKKFAIVGTRKPTRSGAANVRKIARELSESGVSIVSGMAAGIDAASHVGALDGGTPTCAVLGCGVDIPYPPENINIYEDIVQNGAVVSEYKPGTPSLRIYFPARNRIITGMCPGVLIAEGGKRSGASISANYAINENREVFALPGDISSAVSELPNSLIADGAHIALGSESILSALGWGTGAHDEKIAEPLSLDFLQQRLYNLLLAGDMTASELAEASETAPGEVFSTLTMLELMGVTEKLPGGIIHICRRQ